MIDGNSNERLEYNCYHSPSPLNELCEFIDSWEKSNFLYKNYRKEASSVYHLVVNKAIPRDNPVLYSKIKKLLRRFNLEHKNLIAELKDNDDPNYKQVTDLMESYKQQILDLGEDAAVLANYAIDISYSSQSINKTFVWKMFGNHLLSNIAQNSTGRKKTKIIETSYSFEGTLEFLGKNYIMIEEVENA